jgi:hypothetical protein
MLVSFTEIDVLKTKGSFTEYFFTIVAILQECNKNAIIKPVMTKDRFLKGMDKLFKL